MVKFSNTTPLPLRIFGGVMNISFEPPISMKSFNDGGVGGLFLQVFTNQT